MSVFNAFPKQDQPLKFELISSKKEVQVSSILTIKSNIINTLFTYFLTLIYEFAYIGAYYGQ